MKKPKSLFPSGTKIRQAEDGWYRILVPGKGTILARQEGLFLTVKKATPSRDTGNQSIQNALRSSKNPSKKTRGISKL